MSKDRMMSLRMPEILINEYKKFCEEHGPLIGKIPQHQIASYLGITPVALSRVLSKSRKK